MNKLNEITNAIIDLANFYRYELRKQDLPPYIEELKDFELDDINSAIAYLMRKNKFFPRPIEISELIAPNATTLARLEVEYIFQVARNLNLHYWPEQKKKMSQIQMHLIQTLGGIGDISNLRDGDIGPAKSRMISLATDQIKQMDFREQKKLSERQTQTQNLQLVKSLDDDKNLLES